jgi:MoaE-MoaD fusion protein
MDLNRKNGENVTHITVLFFATLRDRAGTKQTHLELERGARVSDLKRQLEAQFPDLAPALPSALIAVNREYAFDADTIPDRAEVALFPPVSGGSEYPTIFMISSEEIDLNSVLAKITLPSTGAACFFTGMVRAVTVRDDPHRTSYLEYEAYQPMAESKMKQVAEEIRVKWPDVEGIAFVQRIGRLETGTPTVMIACTAAHRDSGVFEAARYGIDRLKEVVPVWKKEVGPDGEIWVEGKYKPTRTD